MPYFSKQRAEYERLAGRLTAGPARLRVTSASNGLPLALNVGLYRMVSDVDVYVRQCNATMTVAVANANFLPAGTIEFTSVTEDAQNVVGITGGGSGDVWLTPLKG